MSVIFKLKNSFIANSLFTLIVILIVLNCFFLFAPSSAHINYKTTDKKALINMKAEYFKLNIETKGFFIKSMNDEDVTLSVKTLSSNGSKKAELIIRNSNKLDPAISISTTDKSNFTPRLHSDGYKMQDAGVNLNLDASPSKIELSHIDQRLEISGVNETKLYMSAPNININVHRYEGCELYIKNDDGTLSEVEDASIELSVYYLEFSSNTKIHFSKGTQGIGYVGNISTFDSLSSTGNLEFLYSTTPEVFTLRKESLYLRGDSTALNADIEFNDGYYYELFGFVNSAEMSSLNLFPSFIGWYRENIYLIPLTFISTLIGGLGLTYKARKKL